MSKFTNVFRSLTLLSVIFLSLPARSQLNSFPYAESFEGSFTTGEAIEFLPHWWAKEVAESSRVYQAFEQARSGAAALGLQATGSFSPELRLYFSAEKLKNARLSFWARSRLNGSGTRPAQLFIYFSADSGRQWTERQRVGSAQGFPNEETAYQQYSFDLPAALAGKPHCFIGFSVERGEGSGTTAGLLLDDFLLEEGGESLRLLSARVPGPTEVRLSFNLPLSNSAIQKEKFSISPRREIYELAPGDSSHELVLRTERLDAEVSYQLQLRELVAENGAVLEEAEVPLQYVPLPAFRTVQINEFLPDPNPKGTAPPRPGLPTETKAEFVELYNSSESESWPLERFMLNGKPLPAGSLGPKEYLILTHPAYVSQYEAFGRVAAPESWAALPNESGSLLLTYDQAVVDSLSYAKAWFPADKQAGGWSLEQLSSESGCSLAANWQASKAELGATPGAPNSVVADSPDQEPPTFLQALALDDSRMLLRFSEPIQQLRKELLEIVPSHPIKNVQPADASRPEWLLQLEAPLGPENYRLILSPEVKDCAGNQLQEESREQAVIRTRPAGNGELMLSELMYDPGGGGAEYLELYNASDAWLDAGGWHILRVDQQLVLPERSLLPPGGHLLISKDPALVQEQFPLSPAGRLLEAALPLLPNEGDTLRLLNPAGELQEWVFYTDALHSNFLTHTQGSSLERLCFSKPAQEAENWSSAAGGGSPGQLNTQACPEALQSRSRFWVEPGIFFPGSEHELQQASLFYELARGGATGSIRIYTSEGRLAAYLVNNRLLASKGSFSWDGRGENKEVLPLGYYIAYLQITYADGRGENLRTSLVIGSGLR